MIIPQMCYENFIKILLYRKIFVIFNIYKYYWKIQFNEFNSIDQKSLYLYSYSCIILILEIIYLIFV